MLTYLERLYFLFGVPTLRIHEVRLGYVPFATALLTIGVGLLLTWLAASRMRNLFEPATSIQAILLGMSLMLLGFSRETAANFLFIAFLFFFFTVLFLALMNFKGLNNDPLWNLKIGKWQIAGYGLTIIGAIAAYLVANNVLF